MTQADGYDRVTPRPREALTAGGQSSPYDHIMPKNGIHRSHAFVVALRARHSRRFDHASCEARREVIGAHKPNGPATSRHGLPMDAECCNSSSIGRCAPRKARPAFRRSPTDAERRCWYDAAPDIVGHWTALGELALTTPRLRAACDCIKTCVLARARAHRDRIPPTHLQLLALLLSTSLTPHARTRSCARACARTPEHVMLHPSSLFIRDPKLAKCFNSRAYAGVISV